MRLTSFLLPLSVAAAVLSLPAARAADIGVSIGISQPGVYGRIDIGRFPQPAVIVPQPVIIQPAYVARPVQPVYMWVPPGHRKDWRRHCARYGACGVPVYFVQDRWYHEHVTPPGHRGGHPGRGHGRGRHD